MLGHAPHGANFHAVVVVLEGATDSEEHRADDSVSEHHEEGSSPTKRLHGGDTDEDNSHVRNRGVGDHLLEVGLAQTDDSTPNEGDHTKSQQSELEVLSSVREEGQRQAEHTVGTHLQHDTGQQH